MLVFAIYPMAGPFRNFPKQAEILCTFQKKVLISPLKEVAATFHTDLRQTRTRIVEVMPTGPQKVKNALLKWESWIQIGISIWKGGHLLCKVRGILPPRTDNQTGTARLERLWAVGESCEILQNHAP